MEVPAPTAGTGLLARGMDRSLVNSAGNRAGPAQPRKEPGLGVQMSLGPGRGKGEHEPADPRLFELTLNCLGLDPRL